MYTHMSNKCSKIMLMLSLDIEINSDIENSKFECFNDEWYYYENFTLGPYLKKNSQGIASTQKTFIVHSNSFITFFFFELFFDKN